MASNSVLAVPIIVASDTWHRRLGHVNNNYLIKMDKLVNGLEYQGQVLESKNKNVKHVMRENKPGYHSQITETEQKVYWKLFTVTSVARWRQNN